MAHKVLTTLRCYCNHSSQIRRCLDSSWFLQTRCNAHNQTVNVFNTSNQEKNSRQDDKVTYGGLFAAFTAFTVFLYSTKDKKNAFSVFPIVHAVEKTENNLRKRFNFIADVVEKSANAVVCIESRMLMGNGVQNVVPGGSGFIIKEDGLILTNAHVVLNRQNSIVQVKLKDGRIYTGQIEDVDMAADLATVRIKAKNLPVMELGTSTDLRAGEWVVAIGNPLALSDSVSAGVVSSPQRKGEDLGFNYKDMQYIQTDAAITFGNSGGPLVNLDGVAVGVNSMKVTAGISFATPIEYAKEFLKRSEEKRKNEGDPSVTPSDKKRGYIGITMLSLTSDHLRELNSRGHQIPEFLTNGILICEVVIGSPAFLSGLQPGDVIVEINGEPVSGVKSFYKAVELGVMLNVKIYRRDVPMLVVVTPEQVI